MTCDSNPCDAAACPSHPSAVCMPNYCGSCVAEWYVGDSLVECNADDIPSVCEKPFNSSGECKYVDSLSFWDIVGMKDCMSSLCIAILYHPVAYSL